VDDDRPVVLALPGANSPLRDRAGQPGRNRSERSPRTALSPARRKALHGPSERAQRRARAAQLRAWARKPRALLRTRRERSTHRAPARAESAFDRGLQRRGVVWSTESAQLGPWRFSMHASAFETIARRATAVSTFASGITSFGETPPGLMNEVREDL
jgi:hypothetical protein